MVLGWPAKVTREFSTREGCDCTLTCRRGRFQILLYHAGGWDPGAVHAELCCRLRLRPDDLTVEAHWLELNGRGRPVELETLIEGLHGWLLPLGSFCRICGAGEASVKDCQGVGISLCDGCVCRAPRPRYLLAVVWLLLTVFLLYQFGASLTHPWLRKISKLLLLSGFLIPRVVFPNARRPWLVVQESGLRHQLALLQGVPGPCARVARARLLYALGDRQGVSDELADVLASRHDLHEKLVFSDLRSLLCAEGYADAGQQKIETKG